MKGRGMSRRIIRLAFPAILSNITVPLMGLCDTAISGHIGNAAYLAAIAAGAIMINVVVWLCGFLRMGTTGLTAEAYGAGDKSRMSALLSGSIYVGFAIGIVVVVLSPLLCRVLLYIIDPEPEVHELAKQYYLITIFGLPAQLATMAINGWFVGMQTTKRPMIVAITTNIVNIICSLCVVFLFNAGFKGIAIGTLVANWFGLILALMLIKGVAHDIIWYESVSRVFKRVDPLRFFKVNVNLFFRSACVMGVSMAMTSLGARLGAETLAVNAIIMQFFLFFSYFMDGFAFCAEALCGKAYGAYDRKLLGSSIKEVMKWGLWMMVVMTVVYAFGWQQIVALLTDAQEVRMGVEKFKLIIIILPALSVATFIFDGVYIGLTATRQMLEATLIATIFFAIIVTLTDIYPSLKMMETERNWMLWTAFIVYLVLRGGVLALLLRKVINNRLQSV